MSEIIYGIRPVIEAIEAEKQIERVYIRKGADGELFNDMRNLIRQRGIAVQEVPVQRLNRFTRDNHQGVVAEIAPIEYVDIIGLLNSIPEGETPLIVALDEVTDVGNFGAIARSAECAGAHGIIIPLKNAAPVNSVAMKTSAGALSRIPVCRVGSIRNTLNLLKSEGMQVLSASEKSRKLLYSVDMTVPTVIVMGSEEKGVSRDILNASDEWLAIPIVGEIDSLNVSAAASVMLFEAVRQRVAKIE